MSKRRPDRSAIKANGVNPAEHARGSELRDFSTSLPMSLLRARESVMKPFRQLLRDFDITEQQWRVLRTLSSKGPLEPTALAEITFLLMPSLSRILKELEERKLITRRTLSTDLRRSVIAISAVGIRLIAKVGPLSEAIYAEIGKTYGISKIKELQRMLADLEMALGRGRDR